MAYFHTNVLDNQIKALPTIDTASGSVATFDTDLTENLIEVVCDIPDTGASECNVYHSGKNLFNYDLVTPFNTNVIVTKTDGNLTIQNNNSYTLNALNGASIYLKSGTYYISVSQSINSNMSLYKNGQYVLQALNSGQTSGNFTISNDGLYTLTCNVLGNNTISINKLQIEENSISSYELFNGGAYNIQFGSIILGGTVDVITGKIIDGSDVVSYAQNTVEIPTITGQSNYIFADTGDTEVKYLLTVGKKIS